MTLLDMMGHTADGVFAIDGEQRIVFWNTACEVITGIPAAEALGAACHDLLRGQDSMSRPLCRTACPCGSLARGGPSPTPMCMRITHADGRRLQLSVGTLLLPSQRPGQWQVVHVMRPGKGIFAGWTVPRHGQPAADPLPPSLQEAPSQDQLSLLTHREREILCLLADGLSTKAISCSLHLSLATVRNHIQRLMEKLGVHSRLAAVAYAQRYLTT